jgi:hypothetical protein
VLIPLNEVSTEAENPELDPFTGFADDWNEKTLDDVEIPI